MRFNSLRQFCISFWNVAGTSHSPKGMSSHSKNCKLPMVKAVYCLHASSILICQNPILGPGKKNGQLLPDSLTPPEFLAGGRSPSRCGHWDGRSWCRSASFHPISWPTQPCYTMHSDWVVWHLNPASLTSGYGPLPPKVGESIKIIPWKGYRL